MYLLNNLWSKELLMRVMVIRVPVALLLRVMDRFRTAMLLRLSLSMGDWLFTCRFPMMRFIFMRNLMRLRSLLMSHDWMNLLMHWRI